MTSSSDRKRTQFDSKNGAMIATATAGARLCESKRCPFLERRKHDRFSFTAGATVLEVGSGARVDAHTTDLCPGGCYVDTMSGFSVGAMVQLRLTKDGKTFHSMAKVVTSQAGVGMGLAFVAVDPDQFLIIDKWFAELRGERAPDAHSLEQDERAQCGLTGKDELRYAMEALLVQLMRKEVLTEEEGEPILRHLLR